MEPETMPETEAATSLAPEPAPEAPRRRRGGRPRGNGPRQKAKTLVANRAAEQARINELARSLTMGDDKPEREEIVSVPPPPEGLESPPARGWPIHLRRLAARNAAMLEDFNLSKQQLHVHCQNAERGVKAAIEALEPIKHFMFEMMRADLTKRRIGGRDGKYQMEVDRDFMAKLGKAGNDPKKQIMRYKTEMRSAWGVNENDQFVVSKGQRPLIGHWKQLVDAHFPKLAMVMEWASTEATPPDAPPGVSQESVDRKFNYRHKTMIANNNPKRANSLRKISAIMGGARSDWDGR
jgi:hypothetical protein